MEGISIFNFRSTPKITTAVKTTEILTCKEAVSFEASQYSHIFVMLVGSGSYSLETKEPPRSGVFSLNHIFLLSPNQSFTVTPSTQTCQLLHIAFDLFEISPLDNSNSNEELYKKRRLVMLDECVPIASFEEKHPYFQGDVHNLTLHCKLVPINKAVLSYTLENVIHTMLEVQIHSAVNDLKSVHGIAISNTSLPTDEAYRFSISDISIWSDSPKTNQNAKIVATAHALSIYFEQPTNQKFYSFEKHREEPYSKFGNYCDVCIKNYDNFKIWQFPKDEIPPLDKYVKSGTITFRFKASKIGIFTMNIYQIPTYKNISYNFEITQPNIWTEFEIPISKSLEFNILPPYAEKAIQYIHQNFAEKITIKDIAKHVRIHPSYLSSIFRKHLNQSVNSYINFHRITIAKQMLRNTDSSITDIALLTGFYDSQHFLKTFKKSTGHTPSEYRNML